MGLIVSQGAGFTKELIPADTYPAVFAGVVELGTQPGGQYGPKKQVRIWWQIPSMRDQFEHDGEKVDRPRMIGRNYNLSFGERSSLYKDLIGARGRPFTAEELDAFDLFTVLGAPCMLSIIHDTWEGRQIARIDSVIKLMKGVERPAIEGEPVRFSFEDWGGMGKPDDLPDWMWEKVAASPEYAAKRSTSHGHADPMPDEGGEFANDRFGDTDDIPF